VNQLHRGLKWLAVVSTIAMLLVLIDGSLVTNSNSSMGCGRSWPLCHGKLVPDFFSIHTLIELSHRMISGVTGILVLLLSIFSWKAIGHKRETKFLSILSFLFLVIQSLIGAAAVIWQQSSFVLALHFGISLISFASVLLLTLLIFEVDQKFDAYTLVLDKRLKWHTVGVTIYSYIVVYSGALVRHTNSSLVCRDFPMCLNNAPGLLFNTNQWIQMGHRTAALIIFLWIGYLAIKAVRQYKDRRVIYWGWIIAFILVCLQALAGVLIIYTHLSLFAALLHVLFISCLFGLLSYLALLVSRSHKN
jgi:cytochrome c oxidase assembly protein subunit 15